MIMIYVNILKALFSKFIFNVGRYLRYYNVVPTLFRVNNRYEKMYKLSKIDACVLCYIIVFINR